MRCKHYANTPQYCVIRTHLPILCRTFGNKTRGRKDVHTRPHNCVAYAFCAKKPPLVRFQLFRLHSEDMFSHNAVQWHSQGKQLAAVRKVCWYSTGFLGFFLCLVLKHSLTFRELNVSILMWNGCVAPHADNSFERVSPCKLSPEWISFFLATRQHSSRASYHSLFCLTLLQTWAYRAGDKSADLKQAPRRLWNFAGNCPYCIHRGVVYS